MKRRFSRIKRSQQGNMLSMTFLIGGILLAVFAVAFCFYMLLSEHAKGQHEADRLALDLAQQLNDRDRVGKVNNFVARNRELVYVTRETTNLANGEGMDVWSSLGNRLTEEARASTTMIENERLNQINLSKSTVRNFVEQHNMKTASTPSLILPWWKTAAGNIFEVQVGDVKGVESNVVNTDVYPYLRDFDEQQKYFQKGSNLYIGDQNAKLPSPDEDLAFNIAALSAPVDKTVAPARMINPDSFQPKATLFAGRKYQDTKLLYLPSAVKLVRQIEVAAVTGDKQVVNETACATCNGAQPPLEK